MTELFENAQKSFLIFIILILGVFFNTLILQTQSIRLDEAQSIWTATKSIPTILKLTAEDVHVPLYNLILHFWIQFVGTSIQTARLLSFFFFLLTIPVLYYLTKESFNNSTALLTLALFSLSPFIIWYTSEVRMYTLFTLVATLNSLFFLQMVKTNATVGKTSFFFSTLIGFYTHYFFMFLIASQIVYLLLVYFNSLGTDTAKNFKILFLTYFACLITAFILFIPWLGYVLSLGFAANTQPLIPPPSTFNLFQAIVNFLFGFQPQGVQSILVSLWPVVVIILFTVFTQRQKMSIGYIDYFVLITFLPITFIFLASFIRPIFLIRYLIFTTPTFFTVIAWVLSNFPKNAQTYVISFILVLLFGMMVYQNTSTTTPVKEDYSGVAKLLNNNASDNDIVVVSAPFTIYPIEYSYKGKAKIDTIPVWDRYEFGPIPPFSYQELDSQIKQYQKQHQDIYVVLSYDQGYEKEIRRYFDYNYQLKTSAKFGPSIEVREYKLRYDI